MENAIMFTDAELRSILSITQAKYSQRVIACAGKHINSAEDELAQRYLSINKKAYAELTNRIFEK